MRRAISLLPGEGGSPGFSLAFIDSGEGALLLMVKLGIHISAQAQQITSPCLHKTETGFDITFTSI